MVARAHELLADLRPSPLTPGADRFALPAPDGVATLGTVMSRLDAAGIDLADLALRRPSLDDVFLNITGHATSGAEQSA